MGERTALFCRLGARVVAIEPNPELASRLRRRFPDAQVVEAAVGDKVGKANLHLGGLQLFDYFRALEASSCC